MLELVVLGLPAMLFAGLRFVAELVTYPVVWGLEEAHLKERKIIPYGEIERM